MQVYIKKEASPFDTPHPSLCAFARVALKRGEEKTVSLEIRQSALTVVNEDGERVSGGNRYRFFVGFSQPDERSAELMGERPREVLWPEQPDI